MLHEFIWSANKSAPNDSRANFKSNYQLNFAGNQPSALCPTAIRNYFHVAVLPARQELEPELIAELRSDAMSHLTGRSEKAVVQAANHEVEGLVRPSFLIIFDAPTLNRLVWNISVEVLEAVRENEGILGVEQ
jgi:hypothetical protein